MGQVQSLVRAFSILNELTASGDGLTLTELAGATNLPRSTAHRLLTTMSGLRYVDFETETSRWMIGIQALNLGGGFIQSRDLGRLSRRIMRALMVEVGETVNIAVSGMGGVAYVGQARPGHAARSGAHVGAVLPMHTTASGKMFLAHWSNGAVSKLLSSRGLSQRTALSIVDEAVLTAQLAQIRNCGFAIDDQENSLGMRCVAVPVLDRQGEVRASLSITGTVARLPVERFPRLQRSLSVAAARITSDIGRLLAA
jgi:IclR family acetate operon transcriptional repressor